MGVAAGLAAGGAAQKITYVIEIQTFLASHGGEGVAEVMDAEVAQPHLGQLCGMTALPPALKPLVRPILSREHPLRDLPLLAFLQ